MAAVICERRLTGQIMLHLLSLGAASLACAMVLAPHANAALRHQYTFNTAVPASGVFQDLTGNADGTLFGTATVSGGNTGQLILPGGGSGEVGNHAALLPNGTDGININTYTSVTFSLWATWNGATDWQRYLDFGGHSTSAPANGGNTIFMTPNAGGAPGVRLAISNVDLATQSGFNNEQSISAVDAAPVGVERHVVGVFDGTNDQMRLYVNGLQVAQSATPVTHMLSLIQTDAAYLGAALYNDPNFVGSINQFEMYDTPLTNAEVVNLFVAGKVGEPQTPVPQLTVNRDTGVMTLSSNAPVQVLGYSITSAAGSLNSANWQTIAANFDATSGGEVDVDDEWTVLSAAGSKTDFSEFTFDTTPGNGGLLGPSFSPQLGNAGAWRKSIYEDLRAQFKLADGTTQDIVLSYTGNGGAAFKRSDFNFDNLVTGADWLVFRTNNLVDLSTMTLVEAYTKGDLNGDRDNDFDDFLLFKADFNAANGGNGAFEAMVASVPEPASLFTLALGAALLAIGHRRRSTRRFHAMSRFLPTSQIMGTVLMGTVRSIAVVVLAATTTLLAVAPAHAVLSHQYTFNNGTANDSVGTSHGALIDGTLAGAPAVTGGQLRLNNPGFTGPSTAANYLSLPPSILPTSGSVTIEQWFTFNGSGFFTEAWVFSDRNGGANPPAANTGQYFMNTISNPQGGPNPGGGGSSIAQTNAGTAAETRAYGTTAGIGAGGGGYLDDGQTYYTATVLDSGTGMLNYYVFRQSDGVGGLQSSIPATPLNTYAFNEAFIGRSPFDVDNATSGSVDEFRIHTNALTAQQVADNFYFGPTPSDGISIDVSKSSGLITLKNTTATSLSIDHYSIISRGGALNSGWAGLGSLDSVGAGEGQSWSKSGGADANELAELFLSGSSTFDQNESHSIGTAYNPATFGALDGDLVFQYHLTTGERLYGKVTYAAATAVSGDYNGNGVVDAADYTYWRDRLGQNSPLPNTNPADVDGVVTQAEYGYWKSRFGATSGSGAIAPAAVPEPATWLLAACIAGGALVFKGRRRTGKSPIQGSETMNCTTRSNLRRAFAALLLVVVTSTAASAATKDRFYQFGDDTTENPVVGQPPASDFGPTTVDSAAIGPGDFSDLSYGTGPVYVNTNALTRPDSVAGEWGLTFNGVDTSLVRTNGSLGSPAIGDDEAAYAGNPNYTGITTRLMEGWVRPTNLALGRQDVVNDSTQFGIFISDDDKWSFAHGGTTITSTSAVSFNAWTHVMHRTFTNTAGVLLVNGVAVAATPNDYDAGFNLATTAKNLVFGANVDQAANFFAGQLDNFSIYISGNNSAQINGANWGEVNLATENDYIRQQLVGKPVGDVNLSGALDAADVTAFVANWLSAKVVNGVTVGDLTTRAKGDFDFSGVVNLDDAFTLHQALIGAGAGGLDFSLLGANVPEPSSLLLAACSCAALACGTRCRNSSEPGRGHRRAAMVGPRA